MVMGKSFPRGPGFGCMKAKDRRCYRKQLRVSTERGQQRALVKVEGSLQDVRNARSWGVSQEQWQVEGAASPSIQDKLHVL